MTSCEFLQRWLRQVYPAIVARAKRERAVIDWGYDTAVPFV